MGFRRHSLMETLISIWDNDIGVTRGFSTPGKPGWNQVLRSGIGACNAFHAAKNKYRQQGLSLDVHSRLSVCFAPCESVPCKRTSYSAK